MHPNDFFMQQQEKRKQSMQDNQVSLINHQLANLIKRLPGSIDRNNYDDITNEAQRHLTQCSIWNLAYRQNFESLQAALYQALLIVKVAEKENLGNKRHLIDEADRFMRQIGNIDWGLFGQYNRKKNMI